MKKSFFKWFGLAWTAKWLKGLVGGKAEQDEGGSKIGKSGGFLAGLAAGAGLMYFLDPKNGNRRRSLVADKVTKGRHEAEELVQKETDYLSGKAKGVAHEARKRVEGEEVDDDTLVQRVRAEVGHAASNPGSIEVTVRDGKVTLSGPVLEAEKDQILSRAKRTRGVDEVVDDLEGHKDRDRVPGLQK